MYLRTTLVLALSMMLAGVAHGQTPTTTIQNGNADTRLQLNYDGGLYVPGTYLDDGTENDSIPATGSGTRMMWYPAKAAFRAGQVGDIKDGTQWDAAKVGEYSTAFGVDTEASGSGATAIGDGTTASGSGAMAMGEATTASGDLATAMGSGTTASNIQATAMGSGTTASGPRATAMGSGTTAATDESLSIGRYNSANTSEDRTLFVAGNGTLGSRSDALILDDLGDLAIEGDFTDELGSFAGDFEGAAAGVARDNPSKHVVRIKNISGRSGENTLALQGGDSNPGGAVNFITFFDFDGNSIGAVEGNGSGGVEFKNSGADFAEELPVAEGAEAPEPAEIVGVRGGEARLKTGGADRVMVASRAPILTGNAEAGPATETGRRVEVAFVGQVSAKVRGPTSVGDLIVASGRDDGTARAVSPSEYRRSRHGLIAGQAWSAKATSEVGEVTVAVGLGRSGAVAERMDDQSERIAELEAENEQIQAENEEIKERLAALERQSSSALPAGLTAPWALTVLLGLGALGAGLLWRRRT